MNGSCVQYTSIIDDILVLFLGTTRYLNILENLLKSIHPNISFTTEIEQRNSINNTHDFAIYRKSSGFDTTIHKHSIKPYQHKTVAYNLTIDRFFNISLSTVEYNKKLNKLLSTTSIFLLLFIGTNITKNKKLLTI